MSGLGPFSRRCSKTAVLLAHASHRVCLARCQWQSTEDKNSGIKYLTTLLTPRIDLLLLNRQYVSKYEGEHYALFECR